MHVDERDTGGPRGSCSGGLCSCTCLGKRDIDTVPCAAWASHYQENLGKLEQVHKGPWNHCKGSCIRLKIEKNRISSLTDMPGHGWHKEEELIAKKELRSLQKFMEEVFSRILGSESCEAS